MPKNVIIVESPAKTRTLKGFLGDSFQIEASMGHVRDLPEKTLGVDIDNGFTPQYQDLESRKKVLNDLKRAVKGADCVYLASDPDREGEAIAWHLKEALKLTNCRRIEFNEITRNAVLHALENPRDIDMNRVDAQQARRVLDRLVGYKLSPLLWKKARRNNLSAGRVQSVAVRLVVEREREIAAFVPQEYWTVTAGLTPDTPPNRFEADLRRHAGVKLELHTEAETNAVLDALRGATWRVTKVRRSERRRKPSAPFITSTLQQEASRKLGFSARRTMQVAQQLYEGVDIPGQGTVGLITYMRTDSVRISQEAQEHARAFILDLFGPSYLPAKPPVYKRKGAAQDAHEAIRPTYIDRTPDLLQAYLKPEQAKLYRLIWNRFIASQMADQVLDVVQVDIEAADYEFRAVGSTVKFDGFRRVYTEGRDEQDPASDEDRPALPPLEEGQTLSLLDLKPEQHFTEPPPRYTEATLVKALEENGIGRPSTYAAILGSIVDRQYVELVERKFRPTALGIAVTDYLVKFFPDIMSVEFTAGIEVDLDQIERGALSWVQLMQRFYQPFEKQLTASEESDERIRVQPVMTEHVCPNCGAPLVLRDGRFGKFLGCSKFPECKTILKVTSTGEPAPPDRPSEETCDKCGAPMVIRYGRYGDYLACTACRSRRPLESGTGVNCPACGQGQLVRRRTQRGRTFYGCNRYPDCQFVLWGKPVGRQCPECGSALIETASRGGKEGRISCSAKGCSYSETVPVVSAETDSDSEVADAM